MAGALTPHLTDSNYDEHSEDEDDDDDMEKRVACQKSEGYIGGERNRYKNYRIRFQQCRYRISGRKKNGEFVIL